MTNVQTTLPQVRERHIAMMRLTCETLGHVLKDVMGDQARALRDGADGWSIIEILCHLRDFDEIFYQRALMMRDQDHPQLPGYDHEAMAIERAYQQEDLQDSYRALRSSRWRLIQFFDALAPQQWERGGTHPERDSFTMTDAAMQVGLHDLDHLEQITRVLTQS